MASRIASFVGSVQLRLKIEQATSAEDDPTPIYLLGEAVQAIGSTSRNVADAVDVIQQRLQNRSPNVKQKALKLVKYAAQRGSAELRRALARNCSAIRDLTHFKCAPDPYKGDIPWKRVQEYAKEALDALHAAPAGEPSMASNSGPQLGRRIQGFGSDGAGNSSSGMMGLGSDSVGYQYGGGGGDVLGSNAAYRAPLSSRRGSSAAGAVLGSLSTGVRDFTDRAVVALARPQHERLNSADSEEGGYGGGYRGAEVDRPPSQMNRSVDAAAAALSPTAGRAVSPEQRLVDRICTPSGLRVAPGVEDLKKFIEAVAGMDGVAVAGALHKKLENGSWQEMLRALCAIEALLERNSSASAGEVAVHFQSEVDVIRRAQQSTQATVRQRAERVLKLLGADTLATSGTTTARDLLGGDVVLSSDASVQSTQTANTVDLLGGLDVTAAPAIAAPAPVQSTQSGINMLGDLMGDGGAPAPVSAAPTDDMFGDWSAAAAAPSPVQPKPARTGNILDALADLSIAPQFVTTSLPNSNPPLMPARTSISPSSASAPLDPFFTMPSPSPPINTSASVPFGGPISVSSPSNAALYAVHPPVQHQRTGSLGFGSGGINDDVLGAINAATSGISSAKREDVAFDFVNSAMAELKNKK